MRNMHRHLLSGALAMVVRGAAGAPARSAEKGGEPLASGRPSPHALHDSNAHEATSRQ